MWQYPAERVALLLNALGGAQCVRFAAVSGHFVWYERSCRRPALDRARCVDRHIRLPEMSLQKDSGQSKLIDWSRDLWCPFLASAERTVDGTD